MTGYLFEISRTHNVKTQRAWTHLDTGAVIPYPRNPAAPLLTIEPSTKLLRNIGAPVKP